MNTSCNKITLFDLLEYAVQYQERAFSCSVYNLVSAEADAMRRYQAAVTVMADLYADGDASQIEALVQDFHDATRRAFAAVVVDAEDSEVLETDETANRA